MFKEATCRKCSVVFKAKKRSDREGGRFQEYCSRNCYLDAHNGRILLECVNCKNPFETLQSQIHKARNPRKFCSHACKQEYWESVGKVYDGKLPSTRIATNGYVRQYAPSHPSVFVKKGRKKYGFVSQHRLVMESMLGRYLEATEQVHHKDGDRTNNSPENLELWFRPQPDGQRVQDLISYVVKHHTEAVGKALVEHQNLLNRREQS